MKWEMNRKKSMKCHILKGLNRGTIEIEINVVFHQYLQVNKLSIC